MYLFRMVCRASAVAAMLAVFIGPAPAVMAAPPDAAGKDGSVQERGKGAPGMAERERAFKAEEERLLALRKEIDEKIARYEKLVGQVQEKEKKKQNEANARTDRIVQLYEGMPPEGAAARIAALDDGTAATILSRMKSRKASAVLSLMEPKRAAVLTRKMASPGDVKNFPAK